MDQVRSRGRPSTTPALPWAAQLSKEGIKQEDANNEKSEGKQSISEVKRDEPAYDKQRASAMIQQYGMLHQTNLVSTSKTLQWM